jgi:DNA-binding MarR family transcriptional regulator
VDDRDRADDAAEAGPEAAAAGAPAGTASGGAGDGIADDGGADDGGADDGGADDGGADDGGADGGRASGGRGDGGTVVASPAWLDEEEMPAWLAFLEVSHLLDRAIEQQLKRDAGLSHAQYEILSRLGSADGGAMRMSDLADVIIVSRSGLTYQITQLERAGLVRREKSPSDDRGVLAALTRAGRAALSCAAPGHVRVVREFLIDALTPAQRAGLRDGMAVARARLRAARAGGARQEPPARSRPPGAARQGVGS